MRLADGVPRLADTTANGESSVGPLELPMSKSTAPPAQVGAVDHMNQTATSSSTMTLACCAERVTQARLRRSTSSDLDHGGWWGVGSSRKVDDAASTPGKAAQGLYGSGRPHST